MSKKGFFAVCAGIGAAVAAWVGYGMVVEEKDDGDMWMDWEEWREEDEEFNNWIDEEVL